MKKRLNSYLYTKGKFGRRYREALDVDNPFLYSRGRYPTKITPEDLTEDYIEIFSRVISYMTGYVKTSGIVDMVYEPARFNHMFKDDYLTISYKEKLRKETGTYGFTRYVNYDISICGNFIVDIVLAAEIYPDYDTSEIRRQIEEKRIWFRDKYIDSYNVEVRFDEDIFEHYRQNKYIPQRLLAAYDIMASRKNGRRKGGAAVPVL
jgi:hypothetical protein